VTEREAPPSWDFDYRQDDPYEDDGWFGREQVAEPSSVSEVPDRVHAQPATNVRTEPYAPPPVVYRAPSPPPRRVASPTVSTWTVNGQLRASNISSLTFRSPPPPWYRTKLARIALITAAAATVAVPVVLLAWPRSPATGPAETSVAPQASTTAQPAPSSAHPTPTNAPPPLPPPPPPPTEDTDSAPAVSQPDPWTRDAAPPPTEKPDIGVTRTPATRAPISVAPPPRQPPDNNSATPGDGRRRGCGGWC
jgi:hypothetical protein